MISFTLAKIGKILFIYAHTAIFDIVHLHSLAEFIKFQVFFVFKLSKHEEQAYNACAGILHQAKMIPYGIAEEAAKKCIDLNSCKYFTFKQILKKLNVKELSGAPPKALPEHENIRGKDYYK